MGTIGGLLLVNGISLVQDSRHIDSDHAAVYLGIAFIVIGIISLFIELDAPSDPIVGRNQAGITGLAYMVIGTAMAIHAKSTNDNQQLCWGILFITTGFFPFSKIAKASYWYLLLILTTLILPYDRASNLQKKLEANAKNS